MGGSFDRAALATVDAAYELEGSTEDWLRRLLSCARPALRPDRGLIAGTLSARTRHGLAFTSELVATEDVPKAAFDLVRARAREQPPEYGQAAIRAAAVLDTSSAAYHRHHAPHRFCDFQDYDELRSVGVHDHLVAQSYDAGGDGCMLLANVSRIIDPPRHKRARWARVMAHVCAGLRLRNGLGASNADEAVLEPGGRVVHAEGAAKQVESREALRQAALGIDRARSRAGQANPAQALSDWSALVAGRWSLVETFESDRRRYLVARRNDPALDYPRVLSERERQIAAYAARGWSNKYIAYTLGLAPSTVSSHLNTALRRLGARNSAELALLMSSLPDLDGE
jgi:DNA-binding CsgD family transcriptional regulator